MGTERNEEAGRCAEKALIGPEPACDIAHSTARVFVSRWFSKEHQKLWEATAGQGHAKKILRGPSRSTQADAISMTRNDKRKVVGFITGHWPDDLQLAPIHCMGIHMETLQCRKCGEVEETATR